MVVNFVFYLVAVICFILYMQQKREWLRKIGFSFLGLGFLYFLLNLLWWLVTGENLQLNTLNIFANTLVGIYYFLLIKFKKWNLKEFAPFVATIAFLFTLLGLELGNVTVWDRFLIIHLGLVLITFAVLVLSAAFSLLKLIAERKLKSGEFNLPFGLPATLIFKLEKRLFVIGFLFLTFVLIFNFIWAKVKLKTFVWDSRTISTILIWFYYWLLFHGERFGIDFFKNYFSVLNIIGALGLIFALLFTHHGF
jgi:ABC-type uncharacterized transport system permease subunit